MIDQGFTYYFPAEVREEPSPIPSQPGVYVFCANCEWLTNELGVAGLRRSGVPTGYQPLYIGSAANLQRRVRSHVGKSSVASSFRGSLGTLLAERLRLTPLASDLGGCLWFKEEEVLSRWIDRHCLIGVREESDPLQKEKGLVVAAKPPLNISFLGTTEPARRLAEARARVRHEARRARSEQSAALLEKLQGITP